MAMFRLIVAATILFFLAVRSSCLTAGLATSSALRQRHPSVLGGQTLRGQEFRLPRSRLRAGKANGNQGSGLEG
jgi:hypothetical protein